MLCPPCRGRFGKLITATQKQMFVTLPSCNFSIPYPSQALLDNWSRGTTCGAVLPFQIITLKQNGFWQL
jgi:hypothetical protein